MSSGAVHRLPLLQNGATQTKERQERVRLPLVEQYLLEQQRLTAVEKFSVQHDALRAPDQAKYYRDLIPLRAPESGEQYAFRVDLDRCTGCKACVTACHSLNGLDEDEVWRSVGLLHGGSAAEPMQQTVTTACHHCLDPACLQGCPVNAYEKDPKTGIVKHLDDQCIGCQYCTLTCPYEVPQYNKAKGIVRKCDMCADRLAVGEAPACVQACPNEAIAITLVKQAEVLENTQGDQFLPGAPSPGVTAPTTEYHTRRALPRNLLPADFYNVHAAPNHVPLVVMLVLTQLSVGAFAVDWLLSVMGAAGSAAWLSFRPYQALVALALGVLALGASTLHLGRPHYAFRAVLGVRHSWLSREILAFGAFAKLAVLYAASMWQSHLLTAVGAPALSESVAKLVSSVLALLVVASGLAGVACSMMLYITTRREFWRTSTTLSRFVGTMVLLGVAVTLCMGMGAALAAGEPPAGLLPVEMVPAALMQGLAVTLIVVSVAKLLVENSIFVHLRDKRQTSLRRTALLLTGELRLRWWFRQAWGVAGGVLIPAALYWQLAAGRATAGMLTASGLALLLLLAGELLERSLYFTAVSAPRMPGAIGK